MKAKKRYKKPVLNAVSMIEVGAATCCRTSNATCSKATRLGTGKARRGKNAS